MANALQRKHLFTDLNDAMNRFIILGALMLLAQALISQSICMQVIGSAGGSGVQGGKKFTYTAGEVVIRTIAGAGKKFTEGFQQPEHCMSVATDNIDLAEWQIEIFPNPTTDFLEVQFSEEKVGRLKANVFNLLGQPVLFDQFLDQASGTSLDCSELKAGVYILQIFDLESRSSASVRFVRL